jgi:hypothetical protein
MVGKPSKKDVLKNENRFLKDLVNQLVYLTGACKFEMERLLDEGGKVSQNTEIIREDYSAIMGMLGIESIDPREAKKKEEAKSE